MNPNNHNNHSYFVFVHPENYPPVCVGMFSAPHAGKAIANAKGEIQTSPKYNLLAGMSCRYQVARVVR